MNTVHIRPVILTLTAYYLPGYRGGGPIRTIANMVDRLGTEFDFKIISSDRDLGDTEAYQAIRVNEWNTVGKASVFYVNFQLFNLFDLFLLLKRTNYDVLYLNSFFSFHFSSFILFIRWFGLISRRPIILAPRGEFSSGALRIKSWKKRPFITLVKFLGIFDDVRWHASTLFEANDIKNAMSIDTSKIELAQNISVAPDLFEIPSVLFDEISASKYLDSHALNICFLSRISPMKNLDFALKVLAKVKIPVNFCIFGPKEESEYWRMCELLIAQLPSNIKATYQGSVENSKVREIISKFNLFFVPSLGENFGHVFIEALSAGVPILVSDRTPWRNLRSRKLGWDISLNDFNEFVCAIEEAASFDKEMRGRIQKLCILFAREFADNSEGLIRNRNLFYTAIES